MENSNDFEMKKLLNKVFLWVMFSGILIGIISFGIGYLTDNEIIQSISNMITSIVIGAVIVSLIQVRLLGDFYKEQSRKAISPDLKLVEEALIQEMKKIIPKVKDETVGSIERIKDRVEEAANFMLEGIGVLSGSKKAGIINIFPARYEKISGVSVIDTIIQEFESEKNHIKIMGISLGDYFLDRGVLNNSFLNLLKNIPTRADCKGLKIQALIVHPQSDTLKERARWEVGPDYLHEPMFFDSTTYIETDGAARIARRLHEKYNDKIDIKLYKQAPTSFVLLTSRYAFVESYNYSSRGSKVPMLQVQAGTNLYNHYEKHFDNIWSVSEFISSYDPLASKKNVR
jgi:hypothetical protein